MTVHVVGVDPGSSTGCLHLRDHEVWDFWQAEHTDAARRLRDDLRTARALDGDASIVIACERYQSSGGPRARTHQPIAQQVIGQVRALADEYRCEFTLQTPADAKHFASNARLRTLDLLWTGRDVGWPDANDLRDATRHALLCLATRRATVYERLLESRRRDA